MASISTIAVDTLRTMLWKVEPNRRRAVIISDAFRWDLAQRARRMAAGQSRTVEVEPVLSTLPSITPFGMAALLPLDQLVPDEAKLTVSYETKLPSKMAQDGRSQHVMGAKRSSRQSSVDHGANRPFASLIWTNCWLAWPFHRRHW